MLKCNLMGIEMAELCAINKERNVKMRKKRTLILKNPMPEPSVAIEGSYLTAFILVLPHIGSILCTERRK